MVLASSAKRSVGPERLCGRGVCGLQRPQKRLRWQRFVFCERPPRCARPPAALRYRSSAVPRASRRGQTNAWFLVWVRGSRTRFVLESARPKRPLLIRELERANARRFAPYFKRSAEMGGRKCVVQVRKHCSFPNQSHNFTTADAFSGGRAQRGRALAKRKPSPKQPLLGSSECEDGRSHNANASPAQPLLARHAHFDCEGCVGLMLDLSRAVSSRTERVLRSMRSMRLVQPSLSAMTTSTWGVGPG